MPSAPNAVGSALVVHSLSAAATRANGVRGCRTHIFRCVFWTLVAEQNVVRSGHDYAREGPRASRWRIPSQPRKLFRLPYRAEESNGFREWRSALVHPHVLRMRSVSRRCDPHPGACESAGVRIKRLVEGLGIGLKGSINMDWKCSHWLSAPA